VSALREEDLDLMWAVNARAPMLLCRDALRLLEPGGQIVNVISTAGLRGGAGEAAYNATKFALRGFTDALVEEARLTGVRVHGVYPAGVDTQFWRAATAAGPGVDVGAAFLHPADVAATIVHALAGPPHVHHPELVVRAVRDGDTAATRAKLQWFRS
jgi:NAD(P)-dependent dehydrogenase (short-subunit alcohol dehydrogenase family)